MPEWRLFCFRAQRSNQGGGSMRGFGKFQCADFDGLLLGRTAGDWMSGRLPENCWTAARQGNEVSFEFVCGGKSGFCLMRSVLPLFSPSRADALLAAAVEDGYGRRLVPVCGSGCLRRHGSVRLAGSPSCIYSAGLRYGSGGRSHLADEGGCGGLSALRPGGFFRRRRLSSGRSYRRTGRAE